MKDGRVVRTLKDQRREKAAERRSGMSAAARERAAEDLAEWMHTCPFRLEYDVTVAAYVPVGDEPGSTAMLDALIDRGVTVLLPVVPAGKPAPLDWARYTGPASLAPGRWGLLEPTHDRLGVSAIRAASVVLIPALSVDKTGVRLGRGPDTTTAPSSDCPRNSSPSSTTRSSSIHYPPETTTSPSAGPSPPAAGFSN